MRVSSQVLLLLIWGACCGCAQDPPGESSPDGPSIVPQLPVQVQEDKRIFGVLPNNRTTEESIPYHPLTGPQKAAIAFKDSFDWPVFPTAGAFALLYQLEGQNPSFGPGVKGYAQRLATAYGDQMIGNMMTEGFVPWVTHEDPRYFRSGQGSKMGRAWWALKQIVITRTDSQHPSFNVSEWGGNAAAVAISNAYYPDTRTVSDNVQRLFIACGTDAFSNVLKEFWPDVKQWLIKLRKKG
jgi:hypothetical protein